MVKLLQALFDVDSGLYRRQSGLRNFRGRKLCRVVSLQSTSKPAGRYSCKDVKNRVMTRYLHVGLREAVIERYGQPTE